MSIIDKNSFIKFSFTHYSWEPQSTHEILQFLTEKKIISLLFLSPCIHDYILVCIKNSYYLLIILISRKVLLRVHKQPRSAWRRFINKYNSVTRMWTRFMPAKHIFSDIHISLYLLRCVSIDMCMNICNQNRYFLYSICERCFSSPPGIDRMCSPWRVRSSYHYRNISFSHNVFSRDIYS